MNQLTNKFYWYMIYVLCLLALDQITKAFFATRDFFIGIFHLHLVKNYGLSFGLDFGNSLNLAIILIAFIIFMIYIWMNRSAEINFGALLILGGAISNLIDRVYFGYVRDFIDVPLGFTFNLADLLIVLGIIILLFPQTVHQEEAG